MAAKICSLAAEGSASPLVARTARCRDLGERDRLDAVERREALQVPRPVDAGGLDTEADEGGHRDAAVLDLGVAEPANRLLALVANVERVVVPKDGVELVGKLLEAGLVRDLSGLPRLHRRLLGNVHRGRRRAHARRHGHHGRREGEGS
ncbi:hypothetical protein Ctob_012418, partial [Chrysochromulina tobinii]